MELKVLKTHRLRTVGLASINSAMFGLTRRDSLGKPKNHQGIDLECEPGEDVFVSEDCFVVSSEVNGDYGLTLSVFVGGGVGILFFAHLSQIKVKIGSVVTAGTPIAKTGFTGNAKNMTTKARGCHLHVEVRNTEGRYRGLVNRRDPMDFINVDNYVKSK